MRMKFNDSLECKALAFLNKKRSNVILRRDFVGLGSYSQMTRILKKFVADGRLVKISFGVYAKTYMSKYTDMPLVKGGIDSAIITTLKKLHISFEPGSAEKEYAAGLTMQVPAKNVIRLKSRCRRKIGYGKIRLIYEKNINAR